MSNTEHNPLTRTNAMKTTEIDHIEYPKRIKKASTAALYYIIQDCKEAIAANPEGHKAGYYADEIHYCAMELKRRQTA